MGYKFHDGLPVIKILSKNMTIFMVQKRDESQKFEKNPVDIR